MKLIDVDNFLKQYSDQVCGDTIDAIDLRLALLREPIVDAIPVVRCKDCKFYEPSPAGEEFGWCNYFDSRIANSHYCSYGERKENETN